MGDLADRAIEFLRLIEQQDVAAASSYLAPRTRFIFPKGAEFDDLAACLADRHRRYTRAHKNIDGTDTVDVGQGKNVVYVFGTLEGSRIDGTPFARVRFIDRFTFEYGQIVLQEVWNDLTFV